MRNKITLWAWSYCGEPAYLGCRDRPIQSSAVSLRRLSKAIRMDPETEAEHTNDITLNLAFSKPEAGEAVSEDWFLSSLWASSCL